MIFDGHGDIWTHVAKKRYEKGEGDTFRKYHYEDFKAGNVTGGIFTIWIDKDFTDRPKFRFSQIVDSMREELLDSSDILQIIKTYDDFERGLAAGKITAVNGTEGLSHLEGDIGLLEEYYSEVHIRHASLTWNETNELATGWKGDANRGLTNAGKEAVKKMEALGILLDVSHLNDASFWEVASIATRPFIASHSNVRALCSQMRNLDDNQIKIIAELNGLVGMNSYGEFVNDDLNERTIQMLCEHICYIADLVGTKHIGFGFDFMYYLEEDRYEDYHFDEGSASVKGLGYVREAPNLVAALKCKGFSQREIDDICYNNYMRIFKDILK